MHYIIIITCSLKCKKWYFKTLNILRY